MGARRLWCSIIKQYYYEELTIQFNLSPIYLPTLHPPILILLLSYTSNQPQPSPAQSSYQHVAAGWLAGLLNKKKTNPK